jgi:rhodanese-related sulfurtransferase
MRILSLLAALVCTALFATGLSAADFPEISHDDLKAAIAAKTVTVIDVNGTQSWKEAHIPGAIDFKTAKADLAKVLPANKGALIVAYCGGPSCGAWQRAAKAVSDLGYTNVKHYKDGISGWKEHGALTEGTGEAEKADCCK